MATKKKRRVRSPHPGVVLIPPDPEQRQGYWRARFEDPDSGKLTKVRLDPLAISTAEARRDWAMKKAKAIARRKMELASGAPRGTGTALSDAVARYFADHTNLRAKTLVVYRHAADKLLAWAKKSGVQSADDLTRAKLLAFRAELVRERKSVPLPKGKRGKQRASTEPRSAFTVNREFRSVNTVLRYLRDLDLLPMVSHEELKRVFKRLPAPIERVEYLEPNQCRALLEATLEHDAETFRVTRAEHDAGTATYGNTLRYEPIAPFVAFTLLTGMRLAEAIELDWSQVKLNALDHEGNEVGEIRLMGSETKTHRARTVALEVSPALHRLLADMHLKSGGKGSVFGLTVGTAEAAAKRLRKDYDAPENFGWQMLRRTCGTYLTNAAGIFGAASAYRSAKQLGHSVQVAEKHYVDVARGIPRDARTLEAAMGIEDLMRRVLGEGGHAEGRAIPIRNAGLDLRSSDGTL